MVRLKVIWWLNQDRSLLISIPYGAIKSSVDKIVNYLLSKFQFLMVRLKVNSISSQLGYDVISIPYGAIKSSRT